jgi:hypothetical protein
MPEVSVIIALKGSDGVTKSIKLNGFVIGSSLGNLSWSPDAPDHFMVEFDSTAEVTRSDVTGGVLLSRKTQKTVEVESCLEEVVDEYSVGGDFKNAVGLLLKLVDREV